MKTYQCLAELESMRGQIEMEGAAKPVCMAESVSHLYTHTHVAA